MKSSRLFSLLLVLTMIFASMVIPATAETESKYDKHVTITIASMAGSDSSNTANDPLYQYICEKFNCTIEHYPMSWSNWDEQVRLYIMTGPMPDVVMFNLSTTDPKYSEYLMYVEQGLLKPLPDGWQEKYPNMAGAIAATGIEDKLTIDGKLYMQPHPCLFRFAPLAQNYGHVSAIYRKDWADKLGMDFADDGLMSLDEMKAYIDGCKENDFDGVGGEKITGLTGNGNTTVHAILDMYNNRFETFYQVDGKYVWGAAQPETLEGILALKDLYNNGYIDPDFYLDGVNGTECQNKFAAGTAAILYHSGNVSNYTSRVQLFATQNPGKNAKASVGLATLTDNNGEPWGMTQPNYWAANMFSPDIDEDVFERVLDILEFAASEEGQLFGSLGIEGVHYHYDENNQLVITRGTDEFGNMLTMPTVSPFSRFISTASINNEDIGFYPGIYDIEETAEVKRMYEIKAAHDGNFFKPDVYYDFFVSDSKTEYTSDPLSEIILLVVTPDIDVEKEWNAWLESQMSVVQPLLDDLNAGL